MTVHVSPKPSWGAHTVHNPSFRLRISQDIAVPFGFSQDLPEFSETLNEDDIEMSEDAPSAFDLLPF